MSLAVLILSFGINALALVLPLALLQVYDRILPNQSAGTALVIFSAVALSLVLSGFLRAVRSRIYSRLSAEADYRNWSVVAGNLLTSGTAAQRPREKTRLIPMARDAEAGQGVAGLYDAPFALVFLLLIWFLAGTVVVAPVIVILIVSVVTIFYRGRDDRAHDVLLDANDDLHDRVSDLTRTAEFAGPLRGAGAGLMRVGHALKSRARSALGTEAASHRQMDLMQTAGLTTTVLVVGFGAAQVLSGEMTTGGLAACTLLGGRAASQGIGAILAVFRFGKTRAAARQIKQLEEVGTTADSDVRLTAARLLQTDDIQDGDVLMLQGVDLTDEASVLSELVDAVWGGAGVPTGAVLVPSRPGLVRGSLMDNISAFNKIAERKGQQMSEAIGLDAMVGRLAQGYRTEVHGNASGGLSPGGVKRAAIVRALVSAPSVLILERPEVSLDAEGRNKLVDVLSEYGQDTAIIMTTADPGLQSLCTRTVAVPDLAKTEGVAA